MPAQNVRIAAIAAVVVSAFSSGAHAQGRLEAKYSVSMAGFAIGRAELIVDVSGGRYVSAASGRAAGMLSVLFDGEGVLAAQGTIDQGRPVPSAFVLSFSSEEQKSEMRMVLDHGAVKELSPAVVRAGRDRVPLTEQHRRNVMDPLTALLVPLESAYDVVGEDACRRTLPVFDGRRRYDLTLTYKRMDRVEADKGYSGPVVVCAVTFRAQAGHRPGSSLVKYLSEGRDVELWLAPVAGARVLAPIRATIGSALGTLVVNATQFESLSQTASAPFAE